MTELEHAIKHIKTRADAWAVKEVTEALRSISERLDKALSQEPCTDAVSRQAVIYYIKGHIHEIITESGTDKNAHTNSILRALINGIETMPPVNPQPCDDAISREDAVHALRKALWDYEDKTEKQFRERDDLDYEEWYFHRIFVQAMNDEDVEAICKLPSVTQKSGKWIVVSDGYGDNAYICECSECKDTVWVYKDADRKWNYCPNCGAKMFEPQESEEQTE